jgi:hypothetical protein
MPEDDHLEMQYEDRFISDDPDEEFEEDTEDEE